MVRLSDGRMLGQANRPRDHQTKRPPDQSVDSDGLVHRYPDAGIGGAYRLLPYPAE